MNKSILLVDDEPMIREVVEEKLKPFFDKIYHANNGLEALIVLRENPKVTVIVSDIKMPEMDGIQFIQQARIEGYHQPFIFFTSYASRETLNEVSRHGVSGFIEKGRMEGLEESVVLCLHESNATEDAATLKNVLDGLD